MLRSSYLHPAALTDIEEAASWYAERSVRATDRFLDELDRVLEQVSAEPNRFPTYEANLRRATIRRFPSR